MRRVREQGFTLVELIVAVLITVVLSTMGYTALRQALDNRGIVDKQAQRLAAVQQAVRTIEQDIGSMAPRPVRDDASGGWQDAVVSTQAVPLQFTRGSWANPAGLPRAELQRVAYLLRDGKLVRQHLPVLDATVATIPVERVLLDDVDAFSLRYMDAGLTLTAPWPPPIIQRASPMERRRARPTAVEVTIKLKDYGTIVRLIEVPG